MTALVEVELDAWGFTNELDRLGWGDGLPCLPPTPEVVAEYVAASGLDGDHVVGQLPSSMADCTVTTIAANAAMTGMPREAMPLLCAAVVAIANPDFCLASVNATTASVCPALIVNGPIRHTLQIPFGSSCLGGARGSAPSIGRALRLIIRHVAGQNIRANEVDPSSITSETIFGQPARVVSIVVGEWEERSPWAPLSERRGIPGDAVTAFAHMGTDNICDTTADSGVKLLEVIGKSAASIGANPFLAATPFSEVAFAINPIWADIIARDVPTIEDVMYLIWDHAAVPITWIPEANRGPLEELGRVHSDGRVHLLASPDELIIFVAGGLGSLHSALLPGFSGVLAVTQSIER